MPNHHNCENLSVNWMCRSLDMVFFIPIICIVQDLGTIFTQRKFYHKKKSFLIEKIIFDEIIVFINENKEK